MARTVLVWGMIAAVLCVGVVLWLRLDPIRPEAQGTRIASADARMAGRFRVVLGGTNRTGTYPETITDQLDALAGQGCQALAPTWVSHGFFGTYIYSVLVECPASR